MKTMLLADLRNLLIVETVSPEKQSHFFLGLRDLLRACLVKFGQWIDMSNIFKDGN